MLYNRDIYKGLSASLETSLLCYLFKILRYCMEALHAISEYFEKIAEKRWLQRSRQTLIDVSVIEHQIPGGMASNLIVQLEKQNALNRFEDVLLEIPRVREELGW